MLLFAAFLEMHLCEAYIKNLLFLSIIKVPNLRHLVFHEQVLLLIFLQLYLNTNKYTIYA